MLPVRDRRDLRAGRVALPDPRGQPPHGQARQVAHLGMAPERLGPGAASQEEHRAVEGLRVPDTAEGDEERVEAAPAVGTERLARDGDVLVAGGGARGLAVRGGPPGPEDASLARDRALHERAHVQVRGDRGPTLVVGDAPDLPERRAAGPRRCRGRAPPCPGALAPGPGAGRARRPPSGGAAGRQAR